MRPIITLTTDFGLKDGYVGSVKGAILSIDPQAQLIDICHEIPSFAIEEGAFVLGATYRTFPSGTIHLCVVDPGVGGKRRAIVVRTKDYFFVGPDNGIFSYIFAHEKSYQVIEIKNPKYWRHPVSSTFHARDIFGPVAAHLSRGISLKQIGSFISNPKRFSFARPVMTQKEIKGEIVYIDKFGNFMTNIPKKYLKNSQWEFAKIKVKGRVIQGLTSHYGDVKAGSWAALFSSSDLLEIAVNQGNGQNDLKLKKGVPVSIKFSGKV